jgi:hypothetical protein
MYEIDNDNMLQGFDNIIKPIPRVDGGDLKLM